MFQIYNMQDGNPHFFVSTFIDVVREPSLQRWLHNVLHNNRSKRMFSSVDWTYFQLQRCLKRRAESIRARY